MISKRLKPILVFALFLTAFSTYAHGDLTIRINNKTDEIKLQPNNATLYFERGFLYQQHQEFNKAILDYNKSKTLGYTNMLLEYRKAESYYKLKKYTLARIASETYLRKNIKDVKINKLHAKILFNLKEYTDALYHYSFFINNAVDSRPEDYVELSSMTIVANGNINEGIKVLDNGINKLGNIISLQLQKLDYYKTSNQIEKVIEQYNHFITTTKRKEFWYYKKANYLFENNNIQASKIALEQSKMAVSILKDKLKNTQAIKNLNKDIIKLEKLLNHE